MKIKGCINNHQKNYTRRDFIQQSALLSAGVLLAGSNSLLAKSGDDAMIYRTLGRTGEVRMGKALKGGYRQKVFLMDKIDGRTKVEEAALRRSREERSVRYLMAKDEGHGFSKKSNSDYEFYATVMFIKEYLLK